MCGESGGSMWRVKEKEEEDKKKTHEALRGATGSGNVTVGNASGSALGTVNLGINATVTNIGTILNAGNVNIGNTGASTLLKSLNNYIGNTGVGATIIQSGTTQLNGPLTLGSAPVSGSTASSPTPYLGSILTSVLPTTLTGTPQSIGSITISTPGIYLFTFCIVVSGTSNPAVAYIVPGGLSTTFGFSYINTANISLSGSYIATATGNYYLQLNWSGGSGTGLNPASFFYAIRIA